MKQIEKLVKELKSIDESRSDYATQFERLLAQLVELQNPQIIEPLIDFFNDEAPYDEVMFSIVHSIEIFEDEVFVRSLLKKAESFYKFSPRWASIVFVRVLNSQSAQKELVKQVINIDSSTKLAIKGLMNSINARGAQFLAKTTPIIVAITHKP